MITDEGCVFGAQTIEAINAFVLHLVLQNCMPDRDKLAEYRIIIDIRYEHYFQYSVYRAKGNCESSIFMVSTNSLF